MKDDRVYIEHVLECIRRIEEDTSGGRDAFLSSHLVQDAVLRNLQTMTEATQRLSDGLKATEPAIPWQRLTAFRNVLVHDYLGLDLEQVWRVVEVDVPELKAAALRMAARRGPSKD